MQVVSGTATAMGHSFELTGFETTVPFNGYFDLVPVGDGRQEMVLHLTDFFAKFIVKVDEPEIGARTDRTARRHARARRRRRTDARTHARGTEGTHARGAERTREGGRGAASARARPRAPRRRRAPTPLPVPCGGVRWCAVPRGAQTATSP